MQWLPMRHDLLLLTLLCVLHAEEGHGLTWRTLDVPPEIADVLPTSIGVGVLHNAQVRLHNSSPRSMHSCTQMLCTDASDENLAALQEHLARIGICLAFSPGGAPGSSQLLSRAVATVDVDAREPATLTLFGGKHANVDYTEHVFRR